MGMWKYRVCGGVLRKQDLIKAAVSRAAYESIIRKRRQNISRKDISECPHCMMCACLIEEIVKDKESIDHVTLNLIKCALY